MDLTQIFNKLNVALAETKEDLEKYVLNGCMIIFYKGDTSHILNVAIKQRLPYFAYKDNVCKVYKSIVISI